MLEELQTAPQTSANEFVFPWNKYLGSYDLQSFGSSQTQGRVTDTDVNQLIDEMKRSPYYNTSIIDRTSIYVIGGGGVLALILLVLMSMAPALRTVLGLAFAAVIIPLIGFMIYRASKLPKDPQNRVPELRKIVEQIQVRTFDSKDVRLILSPYGSYLKLEFKWQIRGGGPATAVMNQTQFLPTGQPNSMGYIVPYTQLPVQPMHNHQPNQPMYTSPPAYLSAQMYPQLSNPPYAQPQPAQFGPQYPGPGQQAQVHAGFLQRGVPTMPVNGPVYPEGR